MALLRRLMRYKYTLAGCFVMSCVFGGGAFQTWRFGKETLSWKPTEGQVTLRDTGGESRGTLIVTHIKYGVGSHTYHLVVEELIIEDRVTVYYDPSQPGRAVTTPGVDLVMFISLGFLACLGAFGVFAHFAFALWPHLESEESKYEGDIIELDIDLLV
jgi:hypothetical protein